MTLTTHQLKQQEVIDTIARQVENKSLNFSTISPVDDYENDPRMCLTSVHFPHRSLLDRVQKDLIEPLKKIAPRYYYYSRDSLHMTIKNIRVISNPPTFNETDVQKAEKIFAETISHHNTFNVYFYRLLLFPNNLALIGTTDEELDRIILNLDKKLNNEGIPDDKVYSNSHYFFSNMTLARFSTPSEAFKQKVLELTESLPFEPYQVDSVTLLTSNAVLKNREIKGSWKLTVIK